MVPSTILAKVAVEQLCEVRNLFSYSEHFFICLILIQGYWLKMLGKVADSVFTFKAGLTIEEIFCNNAILTPQFET